MRGGTIALLYIFLITAAACAPRTTLPRTAPAITILSEDTRQHSGNAPTLSRDTIARIAIRIIQAAQRSEFGTRAASIDWQLSLHKGDQIARAYVQPGGRLVLSAGISRIADTEAGLAAILSHEVAHALAHDEKLAQLQADATEANTAVSFSREEEIEADGIGLKLMASAGYNPREMLRVWNRLKTGDEKFSRDPVHSHILYDRRMEQISERLPEALVLYERSRRAPQRALPHP